MLPHVRPSNDCKLDAFNNFLLFGLFCPSFLFRCCIFQSSQRGIFAKGEGMSACMVDALWFRAAARPDWHWRHTCLSQELLRYDDPFRKNKNSDFCATFLRLRTPFRPPRGGNGPLCVRFAVFPGFNPRFDACGNPQSQKSCNFGRISVFWAPGSASCWCHGRGGLGAAPLLMTLGSVVGGAGSAARCGDAPGGATWAAGCLG